MQFKKMIWILFFVGLTPRMPTGHFSLHVGLNLKVLSFYILPFNITVMPHFIVFMLKYTIFELFERFVVILLDLEKCSRDYIGIEI